MYDISTLYIDIYACFDVLNRPFLLKIWTNIWKVYIFFINLNILTNI